MLRRGCLLIGVGLVFVRRVVILLLLVVSIRILVGFLGGRILGRRFGWMGCMARAISMGFLLERARDR